MFSEIEKHRIFGAGGHCLLPGQPQMSILPWVRFVFFCAGNSHSTGDHVPAGKGILIAAAGNRDTAGGEVNIGQSIVGIRQRQAVVVFAWSYFSV